jgi:hypothetical protein
MKTRRPFHMKLWASAKGSALTMFQVQFHDSKTIQDVCSVFSYQAEAYKAYLGRFVDISDICPTKR